MRNRSKIVLAALSATLVLGMGVSTASATHLRILNFSSGFRITWGSLEFIAAGKTIRCPVTLEGTFHRETYEKVARTLIGNATRAVVGSPCTGGAARVLTETLPWNVQYVSFTGTLPNIETITLRLIGASFAVQPTGSLNCLARTNETDPAIGIATLGSNGAGLRQINSLAAEVNAEIPLTGGGGLCSFGGEGHFQGSGTATVLGGTGKTIVSLI